MNHVISLRVRLTSCFCVVGLAALFALDVQAQNDGPGPRSCFSIAYSRVHGTLVFGGAPSCGLTPVNDLRVWAWNGSTWQTMTTVPDAVGAREDSLLAWDSARGVLMLYGGRRGPTVFADLWEWDASGWRTAAPGPDAVEHGAAAFDPVRGRLVLYGGSHRSRKVPFDTTWEWDGKAWSKGLSEVRPEPRVGHAMSWSPEIGAVVLYGGFGPDSPFADLWSWNGRTWRALHRAGPATSEGPVMAACGGALRVLTEDAATESVSRVSTFKDEQWSRGVPGGPPPLTGRGVACDTVRNRLVVFGGNAMNRPASLADVWEFDGAAWHRAR